MIKQFLYVFILLCRYYYSIPIVGQVNRLRGPWRSTVRLWFGSRFILVSLLEHRSIVSHKFFASCGILYV